MNRSHTPNRPTVKKVYYVQAYMPPTVPGNDSKYLASVRCPSRREATRVFGQMRTAFPAATVTLNRQVPHPSAGKRRDGVYRHFVTTTHHHITG